MNKKEAFVKGMTGAIKNWAKNNRETAAMLGSGAAASIPGAYLVAKNEGSTGGDKIKEFTDKLTDKHDLKKPKLKHDKAMNAGGGLYAYEEEAISDSDKEKLKNEYDVDDFDKAYLHTDSPTIAAHEISHNKSRKQSPNWLNKLVEFSGKAGPLAGALTTATGLMAPAIANKTLSRKVLPGMAAGSVAANAPQLYEETQANVNAVREVAEEKGKGEAAKGLPDALASEATYLASALTPAAVTAAHLTRKVV